MYNLSKARSFENVHPDHKMSNELGLKEDYKRQQEKLYQANNDINNSVDQ